MRIFFKKVFFYLDIYNDIGKIGKFNRLLVQCCRSFFTTTVYKHLTTSCIWSCLMSYFKWSISDEATSFWTIDRLYKFSAPPVKLCYVTIKLPIHFGNSSNTILLLYPRSPKGEGGILFYLCPSFCPSKIFFVAFFSVTVDGRNLIFGHKLHVGTPYRGKRFWTRQIPTSCLPT